MKTESAPILILNGSKQPYLSIGIHYGGVKAFGKEYYYIPPKDAFIDKKYIKTYNKMMKDKDGWEKFIEFVKNQ